MWFLTFRKANQDANLINFFHFFRFPLWVLMTTTATYILTSFNCCINFVVYFVMYQAFRKELKATAQLLQKRISSRLSSIKETYSSRKTMHHRCSKDKETSGQKGIELREINPWIQYKIQCKIDLVNLIKNHILTTTSKEKAYLKNFKRQKSMKSSKQKVTHTLKNENVAYFDGQKSKNCDFRWFILQPGKFHFLPFFHDLSL